MADKIIYYFFLCWLCLNIVFGSDKDKKLLEEGQQQKTQFEAAFQGGYETHTHICEPYIIIIILIINFSPLIYYRLSIYK